MAAWEGKNYADQARISYFARLRGGCGGGWFGSWGTVLGSQFSVKPGPLASLLKTQPLKGASEFGELTASLKRCPDTKREFFSNLFGVGRSGFTEN